MNLDLAVETRCGSRLLRAKWIAYHHRHVSGAGFEHFSFTSGASILRRWVNSEDSSLAERVGYVGYAGKFWDCVTKHAITERPVTWILLFEPRFRLSHAKNQTWATFEYRSQASCSLVTFWIWRQENSVAAWRRQSIGGGNV
jgi:hypothetical protein